MTIWRRFAFWSMKKRRKRDALASAQESLRLFTNRYQGGVDNYLQVITAQTIDLQNERNEMDIQRSRIDTSAAY
jgi:outer membrane protein TolC